MFVQRNRNLINAAKQLRKNMTKQERHLWYDFLRSYPVKIYKQRSIRNYIVDFYCAAAGIVIEIDGKQHQIDEIYENDTVRDSVLNELGIDVLRFTNKEVDEHFENVCSEIDRVIMLKIGSPPFRGRAANLVISD